jgi:hypothetical protein
MSLGGLGDQETDLPVGFLDLLVEYLVAAGEPPQCEPHCAGRGGEFV